MQETNSRQKHTKADYTGLFMIVGAGIGTALGTSNHDMIWLPIFMFLGTSFGALLTGRQNQKHS